MTKINGTSVDNGLWSASRSLGPNEGCASLPVGPIPLSVEGRDPIVAHAIAVYIEA